MYHNKNIVRALFAAVAVLCATLVLMIIATKKTNAERTMFTGSEQHVVRLDQATQWTSNFRKDATQDALLAGFFGKNIFEKLLKQDKVVGIRIYNAKHDNGDPVFVLVGVDADGKDLTTGLVGEDITPCPPFCGWPPSVLQQPVTSSPLALSN